MPAVKSTRSYTSRRREKQKGATRDAILAAARDLFARKGWTAATVAAIAREAGVATETVYSHFRTKQAIVEAMVAAAMRGDQPEVPMMEQARRREVLDLPDPAAMIDAFSRDMAEIVQRAAPVLAVVRSAAESDEEMRRLYAALHASRRRNLGQFVERLAAVGGLRDGLSVEDATAHVWSVCAPELWLVWLGPGGQGAEAWRDWAARALKALLLPSG